MHHDRMISYCRWRTCPPSPLQADAPCKAHTLVPLEREPPGLLSEPAAFSSHKTSAWTHLCPDLSQYTQEQRSKAKASTRNRRKCLATQSFPSVKAQVWKCRLGLQGEPNTRSNITCTTLYKPAVKLELVWD